tara:strand:- start:17 stop:376 length:360 start_codon:yes stop_codon:yes gene_type:complete
MKGMHLLPIYYTTNKLSTKKKKRKVSAKMQKSLDEHEKFLKKMGYQPKENRVDVPIYELPDYSSDRPSLPTSDVIAGPSVKKKIHHYNGNAVIGQAYNKGGLQVLSTQEAKDPMTGKRR